VLGFAIVLNIVDLRGVLDVIEERLRRGQRGPLPALVVGPIQLPPHPTQGILKKLLKHITHLTHLARLDHRTSVQASLVAALEQV